jgi:hypothetical protein
MLSLTRHSGAQGISLVFYFFLSECWLYFSVNTEVPETGHLSTQVFFVFLWLEADTQLARKGRVAVPLLSWSHSYSGYRN